MVKQRRQAPGALSKANAAAKVLKDAATSTAACSKARGRSLELRCLAHVGAPLILLQLVYALQQSQALHETSQLDSLELFAGQKAYTRAILADGRVAVGLELNDAPPDTPDVMDFMSARGYALALHLSWKLHRAAQAVAAPVCSSWVWISRGSTGTYATVATKSFRTCVLHVRYLHAGEKSTWANHWLQD